MRPRHYAGESRHARRAEASGGRRFNEAPALRRGKSFRRSARSRPVISASMRPRHYAGESGARPRPAMVRPPRFNEAPALRRGKSARTERKQKMGEARFNEAPALRRGKSPRGRETARRESCASMRPRHYAGESSGAAGTRKGQKNASMRPRHYAGESYVSGTCPIARCLSFNEAPALRRGKFPRCWRSSGIGSSFNEAPALRRGKSPRKRTRTRKTAALQ